MGHRCCVSNCTSNSRNSGNNGVTFHSFPAHPRERKLWIISVKRVETNKLIVNKHTKVCSKHFREDDFMPPQFSKRRMLKKGVVPSIYEFSPIQDSQSMQDELDACDIDKQSTKLDSGAGNSNNSFENFEMKHTNKEFPIKRKESEIKSSAISLEMRIKDKSMKKDTNGSLEAPNIFQQSNSFCSSPGKSDDSEQGSISDLTATNGNNSSSSNNSTPGRKQSSSLNFQIGTRLEAKDLGNEIWYPVKVVEVDWEDEEVLIHFEKWSQRYDEWVPMDSSRLRQTQKPSPQSEVKSTSKVFSIGDRVMAKWSDCRRYPAKVKAVLGNDRYEVLFFDGFTKNIKGMRMTKLEGEIESKGEIGPGSFQHAVPPVAIKPIVKNELISEAIGTKEERRERKRKINVAELFHPKKKRIRIGGQTSKTLADVDKRKKMGRGRKRQRRGNVGRAIEDEEESRKRKKDPDEGSNSEQKPITKEIGNGDEEKQIRIRHETYSVDSADGARKINVVPDKNLPPGWTKYSIQRKHGNSAGKWDVLLVNPQGRKFRSRNELRSYFEERGEPFRSEKFDFCLSGRKRKSRIADDTTGKKIGRGAGKAKSAVGPGGDGVEQQPLLQQQQQQQASPQPLAQRRVKTLLPKVRRTSNSQSEDDNGEKVLEKPISPPPPYTTTVASVSAVKIQSEVHEGEVLVGGLKIQVENNTFKCPKEGCGKNFRKENLLQMHIKHYHPEYNKFMGSTPNVADLAYARTIGESIDDLMPKSRYSNTGTSGMGGTSYLEKMNRSENVRKIKTNVPVSTSGKGGGATSGVSGVGDGNALLEKKRSITTKEKLQSVIAAKKAGKGIIADGEGKTVTDDVAGETKEEKEVKSVIESQEKASTPIGDTVSSLHREEKKEPQTIKTLLPVIRSPSHGAQDSSTSERLKSKFPVEEGEEYVEVIDVGAKHQSPSHSTSQQAAPLVPISSSTNSTPGTSNLTKSLRTIKRRRLSDFHFEPLYRRRKIAKLDIQEDVDVVDDGALPSDVSTASTTTPGTPAVVGPTKSTPTYRYSRKKTPIVHLEKLNVMTDSNGPVSLSSPFKDQAENKSIKIPAESSVVEHLRKEELINCTCGFMEEDGLMIQCDLCLCWQHGICNNIEKETEVPEKYVCAICLNPYRQRKSKKFMHDQDWLKEGKLPSLLIRSKNEANILERETILKRSHDLTGSLLQIQEVLHSLRVKVNIAGKPDHPKLYLWARNWEKDGENLSQQSSASQAQDVNGNEFKQEFENATESCNQDGLKSQSETDINMAESSIIDAMDQASDDDMESTTRSNKKENTDIVNGKMDDITDDKELIEKKRAEISQNTTEITSENMNINKNKLLEDDNELETEEFTTTGINDPIHSSTKLIESYEGVIKESQSSVTSFKKVNSEEEESDVKSAETSEKCAETKESKTEMTNQEKVTNSVDISRPNEPATKTNKMDEHCDSQSETPKEEPIQLKTNSKESVQTKSQIDDSNNITENGSNQEETNTEKDVKKSEERSIGLGTGGLLHQALTNGSHAANPLHNSLPSHLDTSGHPMLQLPICQSELMQFASSMADKLTAAEPTRSAATENMAVQQPPRAPQPEAPIDPVECRLCLLDHIDHFQTQIDTRLTMLEEQVAALESQDPDMAKDESPDFYPQTKQTMQMLLRDLLTIRRIAALN